jgi:hypothetical protein
VLRTVRDYLSRKPYLLLLLLTFSALLVHGYHSAAEDGEIYIPGIKKILNPALYPFGSEFFQNHARLTLFPELIAASVRISHVPFDLILFFWYLASVFLTLVACWEWSGEFFSEPEGRWAGVALLTVLLTLPVAGTALYISDQYLTPRSLALFSLLFAIRNAWHGRYVRFMAWSVFAGVMHPLMAVFGISYGLLLLGMKHFRAGASNRHAWSMAMMPLPPLVAVASEAYRHVVQTRSYFFILQWAWYEWIGIFAPLGLLWCFSRLWQRNEMSAFRLISRSLIVYGLFYFVIALVLSVPRPFETLARLQPMRSLHLLYTFLILLGGGLLGTKILKKHVWRWALLFVPLAGGMWLAQRNLFSSSPHIELPSVAPTNDWLRAFEWIRTNTPSDAVFAIDPKYMLRDDQHGFRAIAERSRLADAQKDSGAVTMFPERPVAEHWREQIADQNGWNHFQAPDFQRLKRKYGISWVVLERPAIAGFACPYENDTILVCRVN